MRYMTEESPVRLHPSWLALLQKEFDTPYMAALKKFLQSEKQQGKVIFPSGDLIFNALDSTPFEDVKVVIIGQDPYHGPRQAHGLSFSVLPGVPFPPSLRNIFAELQADVGIINPEHGCLQSWADQGVLLLNATLTVEQANAGSHQKQGWEQFTDAVIRELNDGRDNLVFVLWGSYAQKKAAFVDSDRHLVLKSPHPSPLSAHRGFFGCGHFSSINRYLSERGIAPIDWSLPPLSSL